MPTTGLTLMLLLGEEDYPRSLRYLLERLENVLNKLKPPAKRPHPRERIAPMREEPVAVWQASDVRPGSIAAERQLATPEGWVE